MGLVEMLDVAQVESPKDSVQPLLSSNLSVIQGVKVKLEVRIGEAELTVDELLNLGKCSVVKLSRTLTTPVDLLLEGKVVAQGQLVAADDNFGIQITRLNT